MKALQLSALYLCSIIVCFILGSIAGWTLLAGMTAISYAVVAAVACLYIGCAEEALFRYLLMDKLLEGKLKASTLVSTVVSSVMFGAAHFVNHPTWIQGLPQVFSTTAAGVVFAYVYRRHGLPAAILLHAAYNWVVMMFSFISR